MSADKDSLICYTIGHSNHSVDHFVELLRKYRIDSVVDIRSVPYSRYAAQFNREIISAELKQRDIRYVYLGNQLGARHTDPGLLFENGKVDFEKVRKTANFNAGIDKVVEGIKERHAIALMCAEKDPFDCHRFVLVAPELEKRELAVTHILGDGTCILNKELEKRLLDKYKLTSRQLCMFADKTEIEILAEARRKMNLKIAFSAREVRQ